MSDTIALFLLPDADAPWRWLSVRDGAIAARGEGMPEADGIGPARVIAIAPADAVALHWADLPDRSQAQAVTAARLLVAEASVTPLGDLHVAVGREADVAARPIGVVAVGRMGAWLAQLAEAGFVPDAVIPAPMLLPRPEDGYVVGELAHGRAVRGTTSGFADEEGLTDLIVGDAPIVALDRDSVEAAVIAALADPPLDLRQGMFALRRRAAIDWVLVRRLGWLVAAIALVSLAITLVQLVRYNASAAALEAQADALARQGLPPGASPDDAAARLNARLTRLRGPGVGFSQTAASVASAVSAVPGAEVTGLAFDPGGRLVVRLSVPAQAQIVDVQDRLAAAGFLAEPGGFVGAAGHVTGTLTVSPR